jgi:hypothetical protein
MRAEALLNQLQHGADYLTLVFEVPVNGGGDNAYFFSDRSDIQGPDSSAADDIQRRLRDLVLAGRLAEPCFDHQGKDVNIDSLNKSGGQCQINSMPNPAWMSILFA